jgi:drug/metabolite transporter (DMT)-like permease
MHPDTVPVNIGVLLLLIATVAWGGMFPAAKDALVFLDPVTLTLIRYGAVSVLLIPTLWSFRSHRPWPTLRETLVVIVAGTTGIAGFNVLMLEGLQHTTPERAAVIMSLLPFATAIIRWVTGGPRPSRFDMIALLVALLGVAIVVSHGNLGRLLDEDAGKGELLVMAGVACWAIYTVGSASVRSITPLQYSFISTTAGSCFLFALMNYMILLGHARPINFGSIRAAFFPLAYMVSFAGVLAIVAWNSGIQRLGSLNGALFINVIPLTTFSIEIARGKSFSLAEIVGVALVVGALVASNFQQRQRPFHKLGLLK